MKRFLLRRFLANDSNEPFVPNEKFQHPEVASELVVDHFNLSIDGSPILKDVSVTIPANKITCIIGPSGCGKSTLLKSLNRLSDSIEGVKTSGDIRLGDTSIVNCSESDLVELRRRIGLVPQRPTPLPMSIFGNIAYGCKIHGRCGTKPIFRRSSVIWLGPAATTSCFPKFTSPSILTPSIESTRRLKVRNSVVLPQPEGPMMHVILF